MIDVHPVVMMLAFVSNFMDIQVDLRGPIFFSQLIQGCVILYGLLIYNPLIMVYIYPQQPGAIFVRSILAGSQGTFLIRPLQCFAKGTNAKGHVDHEGQ